MAKKQQNNDVQGRLPPQAPEIENAIISIIIREEAFLSRALDILVPECFYINANKMIFEAFIEMNEKNKPIDSITLVNHMKGNDKLDDVGGHYYIQVLAAKSDSAVNFEFYCYVVFELFVKREMINLFQEEIGNLYNNDSDVYDIYTRVYEKLETIFESLNDNQIKHMQSSIDKTLNEIESFSSGEKLSYVKTGIRLIDNYIYLAPKFIMGIAAPRGCGKTRFLIHLIRNMFEINDKDDIAALWYSMEDSDSKIIRLFAAPETGLTDTQMQSKGYKLNTDELTRVRASISRFSSYNIDFVNEQESMSKISRNFTRFMKKHETKTCFLIIDNIMLIEDLYSNEGSSNQTTIEDRIAASLRRIVNKAEKNGHRAIVIFLHHMTKEMESRANAEEAYRPKLTHMKGSTRFGDICNAIILLNNPGAHKDLIKRHSQLPDIQCYNSDGTTKYVKRTSLLQNLLIAEVAKNRDGEMSDDTKAVERYVVDFGIMKFNELKVVKNG